MELLIKIVLVGVVGIGFISATQAQSGSQALICAESVSVLRVAPPGTYAPSSPALKKNHVVYFKINPNVDPRFKVAQVHTNLGGAQDLLVSATLEPGKEKFIFALWQGGNVSGKDLNLSFTKMSQSATVSSTLTCTVR